MPQPLGNGQPLQLMRAFRAGATFSTATTGTITVPAGATRIQKIVLSITEDAKQATAGDILITLSTATDTIFSEYVYIPASAGTSAGEAWHRDIPFDGLAFPAGLVTWTLSAALTGGRGSINLYFS